MSCQVPGQPLVLHLHLNCGVGPALSSTNTLNQTPAVNSGSVATMAEEQHHIGSAVPEEHHDEKKLGGNVLPTRLDADETPEFEKVNWKKDRGLRRLYFHCCVLMVASATTGYDG